GQRLPGLAAVGRGRKVSIVPAVLDVIPGREAEGGARDFREVELAGKLGVDAVAPVGPPEGTVQRRHADRDVVGPVEAKGAPGPGLQVVSAPLAHVILT